MENFDHETDSLQRPEPPTYIQMAFKEMREFNVEDTYTHLL